MPQFEMLAELNDGADIAHTFPYVEDVNEDAALASAERRARDYIAEKVRLEDTERVLVYIHRYYDDPDAEPELDVRCWRLEIF